MFRRWTESTVRFFKEVRVEMEKVSWPNKNQIVSDTYAVLIATILVSMFIWLVDIGLNKTLIEMVLGIK
ncbi:preprotein translocase subunit SecE [Candidatus Sumerlaeota bacterium]|nr:preprotein translocase subunit SecE [Candidatus Sumerlaeota bacterium]